MSVVVPIGSSGLARFHLLAGDLYATQERDEGIPLLGLGKVPAQGANATVVTGTDKRRADFVRAGVRQGHRLDPGVQASTSHAVLCRVVVTGLGRNVQIFCQPCLGADGYRPVGLLRAGQGSRDGCRRICLVGAGLVIGEDRDIA